ncbi:MAG: sugar transporter, partial [Pseudomonadota bacterium]
PLAPGADRITDVISRAGGLNAPISQTTITLSRKGTSSSMPVERIFSEPAQNLRLSPGDVITLSQRPNFFIAVGATGVNARRSFGATEYFLSDALGEVGGVLDARGDNSAVYVLRMEETAFAADMLGAAVSPTETTPVAYQFDLDLAANFFRSRQFQMNDKDIIYVANAPTVEIQKLLDIFRSSAASAAVLQDAGVIPDGN